MKPHIEIVVSPFEYLSPGFMLYAIAEVWREWNYSVSIGTTDSIRGDVGIAHIDLTVIPRAFVPLNPLNRPYINRFFTDTSKRRLSRKLLCRDSDYNGPVMVKNNLDAMGLGDRVRTSSMTPAPQPPLPESRFNYKLFPNKS